MSKFNIYIRFKDDTILFKNEVDEGFYKFNKIGENSSCVINACFDLDPISIGFFVLKVDEKTNKIFLEDKIDVPSTKGILKKWGFSEELTSENSKNILKEFEKAKFVDGPNTFEIILKVYREKIFELNYSVKRNFDIIPQKGDIIFLKTSSSDKQIPILVSGHTFILDEDNECKINNTKIICEIDTKDLTTPSSVELTNTLYKLGFEFESNRSYF